MSSAYTTEPATRGKVILHTTKGPIDIELWPKEAPLATRNLVQLALDGYYDGCLFHRLVPGFILQGGDPTGTGHGGESSTGAKLPIESHQRLRFTRRGLVALADGFSQFFITLDKTPELDGKHTLLGKVVGDTLFNVLDMANAPVDANDRPTNPVKIVRAEVVDNPFDDVVPRANVAARAVNARVDAERGAAGEKKVSGMLAKKPTKRSRALLSFGEDEDDEAGGLVGVPAAKKAKKPKKVMMSAIDAEEQLAGGAIEPTPASAPLDRVATSAATHSPPPPSSATSADQESPRARRPSPPAPLKSMQTPSSAAPPAPAAPSCTTSAPKPKSNPTSKKTSTPLWQHERDKYLTASRRAKSAASDTAILDKLAAFKSKLATSLSNDADQDDDTDKSESANQPPCLLHSVPGCLSCSASFGVGLGSVSDKGWMAHKLKFAKDHLGKDVTKGKQLADDMYMVIDPRDALKGGAQDKPTGSNKARGATWNKDASRASETSSKRKW